jgi:hypothetical protein
MPTQVYRTKDGKRVPGVTTVIGKFKESAGLIHWAWKLGTEGIDYRERRDSAADAGTLAHAMVEAHIRGQKIDTSAYPQEIFDKALVAFNAFLEWAGGSKLKPQETELALISEAHRYGGCLDSMLVNGKLSLGDWKTSNDVYDDHWVQLAGYAILWEENFPGRPIEGGYHICQFNKIGGEFAHHWRAYDNPRMIAARELFLCYRRAYDLKAAMVAK